MKGQVLMIITMGVVRVPAPALVLTHGALGQLGSSRTGGGGASIVADSIVVIAPHPRPCRSPSPSQG